MTDRRGPQRDLPAARARAVELAEAAGRLQVQRRADVVVQGTKAHANDLVSDVDQASETLIVDGLRAEWPADGVLAEEGRSAPTRERLALGDRPAGRHPQLPERVRARGRSAWPCSSSDVTQVAVVHDPAAGETFSAVRGGGRDPGRRTDRARPAPAGWTRPSSG